MPKVTPPSFPLSGLIAFHKPSGPTSNAVLDSLKHLFADSPLFAESSGGVSTSEVGGSGRGAKRGGKGKGKGRGSAPQGVKMGQGGTLDPLADGILVVGVNRGTKQLSRFLQCSKEYRTTAILGCSTDSYDAMGAIDSTAAWEHVTPELIEGVLDRFRGDIMQTPPVYSALKMDGKPLYEYARLGLPLPRPVEARKCTVHELVLEGFQASRSVDPVGGHAFEWPSKRLGEEERAQAEAARKLVQEAAAKGGGATTTNGEDLTPPSAVFADPAPPTASATDDEAVRSQPAIIPPTFTLRMTVSSGTYVRSIVNDVAQAISSLATVVVLTRTRQGEFSTEAGNVIPWESVREAAMEEERRFQAARPAILAEKTRKREDLKARQKEKVRLEREAKRRAHQGAEDEEEAMNAGGQAAETALSASSSAAAVGPVAVAASDTTPSEVASKVDAEEKEQIHAAQIKPRRTLDQLFDWEKEILAKFEETVA